MTQQVSVPKSRKKISVNSMEEILRSPGNKKCNECGCKIPTLIDLTMGTVVCLDCSGILRELDHKIKSVSSSWFTVEEMQHVLSNGNQKVNSVWLARSTPNDIPRFHEIDDKTAKQEALRRWMRSKYILMEYYATESNQIAHQINDNEDDFGEFCTSPPIQARADPFEDNTIPSISAPPLSKSVYQRSFLGSAIDPMTPASSPGRKVSAPASSLTADFSAFPTAPSTPSASRHSISSPSFADFTALTMSSPSPSLATHIASPGMMSPSFANFGSFSPTFVTDVNSSGLTTLTGVKSPTFADFSDISRKLSIVSITESSTKENPTLLQKEDSGGKNLEDFGCPSKPSKDLFADLVSFS